MSNTQETLGVVISGDAEQLKKATEEALKLIDKLRKKTEDGLGDTERQGSETAGKLKKEFWASADKVGNRMSLLLTAPLVAAGKKANDYAREYETAMVAVKKTVEGTAEDFKSLEKDVAGLSDKFAIGRDQVLGYAATAGQLGIKTKDIAKFTEVVLGLESATNLSGEEAATQLAKFANITGLSPDKYQNLASAIVDVGNNSATTERDITNMLLRIGAAGSQFGLTQGQLVGLAGALSSFGLEAEGGGSAISRVMNKINTAVAVGDKNLESLANVAGMTVDEFKKLKAEDPKKLLLSFVSGLGEAAKGGQAVAGVLDELNMSDIRVVDALGRISLGQEKFTETLNLGSEAFEKNIALNKEVGAALDTNEIKQRRASIQLKNALTTLGQGLAPVITDIAKAIAGVAQGFSNMSDGTRDTVVKVGLLAASLGPVIKGATTVHKTFTGIKSTIGWIGKSKAGEGIANRFAKAAAEAKSAGGGIKTFAKSLAPALFSPAGLALAGVAAAVGLVGYAAYQGQAPIRKFKAGISGLISEVANFRKDMENATSSAGPLLDGLANNYDTAGLESEAGEIQKRLTTIWEANTKERKAMTQSEMSVMEEYLGKLDQISEKTLEKVESAYGVLGEKAKLDDNFNYSDFNNSVKTARDLHEAGISAIESNYEKKLIATAGLGEEEKRMAHEVYKTQIELENKRYAKSVELARARLNESQQGDNAGIKKLQEFSAKYESIQSKIREQTTIANANLSATSPHGEFNAKYREAIITIQELNAQLDNLKSTMDITEVSTLAQDSLKSLMTTFESTLSVGVPLSNQAQEQFAQLFSLLQFGSDEAKTTFINSMRGMLLEMQDLPAKSKLEAEKTLTEMEKTLADGQPMTSEQGKALIDSFLGAIGGKQADLVNAGKEIHAAIQSGASGTIIIPVEVEYHGVESPQRYIPNVKNPYFPNLPHHYSGSANFSGGLTHINERGGEIVNLPRGSQIIPNDISKRLADRLTGGGSPSILNKNYTVNLSDVTINDARDVRSIAKQLAAEMARY